MIIYKIYIDTCLETNKLYIGYTKHDPITRWAGKVSSAKTKNRNIKLDNAIRKYGNSNWTHDTIYSTKSREHILIMEQYFIKEYDTYNTGYNSTLGGESPTFDTLPSKWKESISNGLKRAYSTGYRQPVSHNAEVRNKIRVAKSTGIWITPHGNFISANLAAQSLNTSRPNIRTWCKQSNKIISKCSTTCLPEIFNKSQLGLTFADVGFGFKPNLD